MEETKKKGRKPAILDFQFNKILPGNFEERIEQYLEKLDEHYYRVHVYPVLESIYDFYHERYSKNKGLKNFRVFVDNFTHTKSEFIEYLHTCIQQYIRYEEMNIYYFLRYRLNDLFQCEDKNRYFDDREEAAIKAYLSCTDYNRKNIIYEKFLKFAFEKLVENIINTYKLHSSAHSFDDLLHDTVSFLHSKLDLFNPEYGTKAYSYLGTIAKHQLQTIRIKEEKNKKRYHSYEEYYTVLAEDTNYTYEHHPYERNFMVEFSQRLPAMISDFMAKGGLSENEKKVGNAIITIMDEWHSVGKIGNKINKNLIFESIRNLTGLSTKDIREGLRVFRPFYYDSKKNILDREYNPMD